MIRVEDALVSGVRVDDTSDLFEELKIRPWRFGVRVAAALLRNNKPEQALATLEELISITNCGAEMPKYDVSQRLEDMWKRRI